MNNRVFTVLGFEFTHMVKSRGYRLTTVILALLVFAIFFIPGITSGGGNKPLTSVVIDDIGPDPEPSAAGANTTTMNREVLLFNDDYAGGRLLPPLQQALPEYNIIASTETPTSERDEQSSALLYIDANKAATLVIERLDVFDVGMMRIEAALQQAYQMHALTEAGLSPDVAEEALNVGSFQVKERIEDVGKSQSQMYAYTYAILFLLYMAVIIYGQVVAGNVASEKGNRTMELLITSTKPLNLLVGKVFGVGLAGLLQLGIVLGSALLSFTLNPEAAAMMGIGKVTVAMVLFSLLFFFLSFFTYAFVYSALGSLVSRAEDVNKSATLITFPLIVVFFTAMMALFTPEAGFVKVLSFVPLFSPFVMFVRTQMAIVPPLQVVISVAINLLTLAVVAFISAKIYRLGTLFYGNQLKLRQLIRLLKY